METITPEMWQALLSAGGAPIAFMLAAKFIFNGTSKTIQNISNKLDAIDDTSKEINAQLARHGERLARLEARSDLQYGRSLHEDS